MPGTHRSTCVGAEFCFSHQRNGNYTKVQLAGFVLGTQPTTRVFIPNDLRRKLQPGCQADSGAVFAGVFTMLKTWIYRCCKKNK